MPRKHWPVTPPDGRGGSAVPAPSRLDDLPYPIEPDIAEVARLLVRLEVRERAPA
jgi:hypothetical protein